MKSDEIWWNENFSTYKKCVYVFSINQLNRIKQQKVAWMLRIGVFSNFQDKKYI